MSFSQSRTRRSEELRSPLIRRHCDLRLRQRTPTPSTSAQFLAQMSSDTYRGAEISFTANAATRQRQAAQQPSARPGSDSPPVSDDDSERMPLNASAVTSRGPISTTHAAAAAAAAAQGGRTPSGFGVHSPYSYPTSPGGGANKREKLKGHPVIKLSHLVSDHPYLFVVIGLLLLASCFWLVFMPHPALLHAGQSNDASTSVTSIVTPVKPAAPPSGPEGLADSPAAAAAVTSNEQPAAPAAPPAQLEQPKALQPVAPPPQPEVPAKQPDVVTPASAPATNSAADVALGESADKLSRADLNDKALHCAAASTTQCDWSWGQFSRSANSEDHPREDLVPDTSWRKPQDFYSFQAGLHVSGEGTGVIVRIYMRDLCCRGDLPLSYFRITAHGAAQAASNPPLALGPRPTAMERGHQPVHLARRGWGRDIDLSQVDEERVVQTFLLLPDAGVYSIRVSLSHYNSSVDMTSENFQMNSKEYVKRPGTWVNGLVKNVRGEIETKLTIPASTSFTHLMRAEMPVCGAEGGGRLGGFSPHGTRYGWPLAGRWVFQPPQEPDASVGYVPVTAKQDEEVDYTALDRRWLVEHSVWTPYFCRLELSLPSLMPRALEKVQWMHFTGDSNTRHMFFFVCEMANGTLMNVNPDRVPRYLDPPHFCIGPSSIDNRPDSESGLPLGSSSRWVLTYTNWFWGKQQTLTQPETPGTDFHFRTQCGRFVEQNQTGLFYGWPSCSLAPDWIQELKGPGLTYFGWGSHAAELARNPATASYFLTSEAFGLPYFQSHPVLFPLTTANTPSLIPDKFGPQQRMRNNERVHASNLHMVEAIMHHRFNYATKTIGGSSSPLNWIPIFDLFSPTFAAYEVLAVDAVHFEKFFSYEEPKYLAHYILNAPNFGKVISTEGHKQGQ